MQNHEAPRSTRKVLFATERGKTNTSEVEDGEEILYNGNKMWFSVVVSTKTIILFCLPFCFKLLTENQENFLSSLLCETNCQWVLFSPHARVARFTF